MPDRSVEKNLPIAARITAGLPGPVGYYPSPDPDMGEPEDGISVHALMRTLRRRVWVVLGVTALITGATAMYAYTRPPRYQATATIALANTREELTGNLADASVNGVMMGSRVDPLLSQVEILSSRTVLTEVVEAEGLRLQVLDGGLSPRLLRQVRVAPEVERDTVQVQFGAQEFSAQAGSERRAAPYGSPVEVRGVQFTVTERPDASEAVLSVLPTRTAVQILRSNLIADPREPTNLVDVRYTGTDREVAQRVTNAVVTVFQEISASSAQQQSRRRRQFLEAQLAQTDSMLRDSHLALSNFRSREEVYSSGDKMAAQQTGLMDLKVRREEMRADRDMYQSLLSRLSEGSAEVRSRALRTLVSSPGLGSNPVVNQNYASVLQYQVERDTLTAGGLGSAETNPDVKRLDAMIASAEIRLLDAVRSHITSLDARIAALNELESRSAAEIRVLPNTEAEEQWLVRQLHTIQGMADDLRSEYQRARIAEAVEAGQVEIVDLALLPPEPVGSGPLSSVMIGLVLGLMLGCGGALVVENLNTTVRHRDELESTLRVPGLAVIPKIGTPSSLQSRLRLGGGAKTAVVAPGKGGTPGLELVTVTDVRSSGSEAYRTLRTNLIFSQAIQSLRTLVVTSSTPSEGKTTTAANLAVTYAQQGIRVLIVDCDLRKARLHKVFGISREPGLTQLMLQSRPLSEVVRETNVPGLDVLPAGTLPPNPSELLGGEGMGEILNRLTREYQLVILDTPPLLSASDAAVLGRQTDGVLFVIRAGRTDRAAAQQAMHQLRAVGARVVGAVLNDPDAKVPTYGEYYYAYSEDEA